MHPARPLPGWFRRLALPALFAAVVVAGFAGSAAAQDDPFVTNGPEQLGERVSESEQATQRLNLAVAGLLGLAAVIGVSSVVFWRLSAPQVTTSGEVQPAFRIEFTPPGVDQPVAGGPPPFAVPTVASVAVVPAAASPQPTTAAPAQTVYATSSVPAPVDTPVVPRAATPFPDAVAPGPTVSVEDVSPGASVAPATGGTWASQGWGNDGRE
jgi:hypothetical protein